MIVETNVPVRVSDGTTLRINIFRPPTTARLDISSPGNQRKLDAADALAQLADDAGLSLIHLSLAFVMQHPHAARRHARRCRRRVSAAVAHRPVSATPSYRLTRCS